MTKTRMIWFEITKTENGIYLEVTRALKSIRSRHYVNNAIMHDITPASLRRVCRLLQGNPPFGEVCNQQEKPALTGICEWRGRVTSLVQYVFETSCGAGVDQRGFGNYCPYCGRRVKVTE